MNWRASAPGALAHSSTAAAVFAVLVAVGIFSASSTAQAQTGLSLSGRRSANIERRVVRRMQDDGMDVSSVDPDDDGVEQLSHLVIGRITKRGRRWRARLSLYNSSGDEVDRVNASARTANALGNQIANRLRRSLERHASLSVAQAAP